MEKSIKRSIKHYDSMIKRTKRITNDNSEYDLVRFLNHLKSQRDKVASQIGKNKKK